MKVARWLLQLQYGCSPQDRGGGGSHTECIHLYRLLKANIFAEHVADFTPISMERLCHMPAHMAREAGVLSVRKKEYMDIG